MLNNIKALVLLLPILFTVFFAGRVVFGSIVAPKDIDRWRNILIAVTSIGFLVPNFWIMLVMLSILVLSVVGLQLEKNLAALFLVLVVALPPQEQPIPGFAGINQIFPISPPLLMSILIFIPALFFAKRIFQRAKGAAIPDFMMVCFVLLSVALAFRDTSFTDGLRGVWLVILTTALPYFVVSRWSFDFQEFRMICVAIVLTALALAGVALLETVFSWHFYAMPSTNWHGVLASPYNYRSGFLRVYASLLGPLEFGFLLVLAIALGLAVLSSRISRPLGIMGLGGYAGALLFTFSRGPWLGAIIAIGSFIAIGPKGFTRSIMMGFVGAILAAGILVSPLGDGIIKALPFVNTGSDEADETISYRQKLFTNGVEVIMENPVLGSTTYYEHPKMIALTQGQGIIDLVNSYIQVALAKGLLGLFFFAGILLSALWAALRAMALSKTQAPELSAYARGCFAAMAAIIVVIGTTSSNPPLPILYFSMAGLCVSIRRIVEAQRLTNFAGDDAAVASPSPTATGPNSTLSIRKAQEDQAANAARTQKRDAEAQALARKNADRKRAVQTRNLPAHLRQYAPPTDE
ncbi:MAG: O-antigen ligase family protein [Pseudomonadota bacterium]